MIINLIVLRNELRSVYFFLSHDTLSVVGVCTIIPENGSIINLITTLIINQIANQVVKVGVPWVRGAGRCPV